MTARAFRTPPSGHRTGLTVRDFGTLAGIESRNGLAGDALAQNVFDGREFLRFFGRDEGDRFTRCIHAAGAADAVNVVLRGARHVEIDHVGHVIDVDPARGDIGRHQHADAARLEVAQRAFTLALAAVTVDRRRRVAGCLEPARQAIRAMLGAGEHDRRVIVERVE